MMNSRTCLRRDFIKLSALMIGGAGAAKSAGGKSGVSELVRAHPVQNAGGQNSPGDITIQQVVDMITGTGCGRTR